MTRSIRTKKIISLVVCLALFLSTIVATGILTNADENTNLALGKTVTASNLRNGDDLITVTDGVKNKLEDRQDLPTGEQWITVDLGAEATVDRIVVYWESEPSHLAIETSLNNETWDVQKDDTEVVTTGYPKVYEAEFAAVSCRYVRIHMYELPSQWGYGIVEFEVYGTYNGEAPTTVSTSGDSSTTSSTQPTDQPTATTSSTTETTTQAAQIGENIALGKTASVSEWRVAENLDKITDGVNNDVTNRQDIPTGEQWVTVDLWAEATVDKVVFYWESEASHFAVETSLNGEDWTVQKEETEPAMTGRPLKYELALDAVSCRYVRVHMYETPSQWGYGVVEFEVYGEYDAGVIVTEPTTTTTTQPAPVDHLEVPNTPARLSGGWGANDSVSNPIYTNGGKILEVKTNTSSGFTANAQWYADLSGGVELYDQAIETEGTIAVDVLGIFTTQNNVYGDNYVKLVGNGAQGVADGDFDYVIRPNQVVTLTYTPEEWIGTAGSTAADVKNVWISVLGYNGNAVNGTFYMSAPYVIPGEGHEIPTVTTASTTEDTTATEPDDTTATEPDNTTATKPGDTTGATDATAEPTEEATETPDLVTTETPANIGGSDSPISPSTGAATAPIAGALLAAAAAIVIAKVKQK